MQDSATPSEKIHVHVLISGRVQGVGYRYSTVLQAKQLKINGWVRNLTDGRVEAVFEGDRIPVEQMVHWCYDGPPAARVRDIRVVYDRCLGLKGFETRY